ncbi:hypothetical protein [Hymenobacter sp. PAMC 26628]|uniref:hypothetical protein n=1 Tax=Hymenobacter sp. PAMC 26628 TaxID=1484118 RepID=UPI000770373A|nr:hypothetical protein [Hymenobacter sp. PAMC 26628]AMJ65039.1 hypothetical protein AXW84_06060 [Hymenobacter sp. PAMC 26628]
MSAVQQWLQGPQDYEAGRQLYEQLGRNAVLKRTLSHGPTAYNRSALREELAKLATLPFVPLVTVALSPLGPRPAPAAAHPDATRELLLGLEKQWKPLYKEASFLQSQLEHAKDNQARCTTSHAILDKMEQVQALWDAGDYVREHGQLPPAPVAVAPPVLDLTDAVAVLKRRNNLRAQISKQARNAERAGEVAAWRAEVEALDDVLKTLNK